VIPTITRVQRWHCPACGLTDVTREFRPHTRFHSCTSLRGLTAPMLEAETKAKMEVKEREDYVGTDDVAVDQNGRPVMSIVVTRDDGQDVVVFAPTARARVSD
jgi:hypothetical protein